MQRLEVSGAVRPIYGSLGFKWLSDNIQIIKVNKIKINIKIATSFLRAFAKWRNATISFVMSVHLSVCPSAWDN